MMYDAIVIGARCAGSPTAMLLAQKGHTVLLVDRATFPSHIPHGHFIHKDGPRRLKQWGLIDKLVKAGCPPATTWTFRAAGAVLRGTDLIMDDLAFAYAPRRDVLDKILVDAAAEAGAEVREGFSFLELVTEGDRVTDIRGRDNRSGTTVTERARIVIGADGRNSQVARAVQAPIYDAQPTLVFYYFSYWSGLKGDGLELTRLPDRKIILAHPTTDGLFAVFVGWGIEQFQDVRADIEGNFMSAIDQEPGLAERLRNGRREERFFGARDLPNFFRKPYGDGWALVGDAGYHKDPYLALGVSDAFRDADFLAEAIDEGLSGKGPIQESLAAYEERRNEATMPDYQQNLALASFAPPPPEMVRLFAALENNQEDTNRLQKLSRRNNCGWLQAAASRHSGAIPHSLLEESFRQCPGTLALLISGTQFDAVSLS
jgi:flavin-dependent dehydrogenase